MDDEHKIFILDKEDEFSRELKRSLLEKVNINAEIFQTKTAILQKLKISETDLILINLGIDEAKDHKVLAKTINIDYNALAIFLSDTLNDSDDFITIDTGHVFLRIKENIPFICYNLSQTIKRKKFHREKERLSQLMLKNSEKFNALFQAAKDSIIFMDMEGQIIDWNNATNEMFGYSIEDIFHQKIWELFIADEHKDEFMDSFNEWKFTTDTDNFNNTMELYCKKAAGNIFPAEMTLAITEVRDKRFICAFINDISERIAANEEIERLVEEMQVTKEIVEDNASELVMLNSKLHESEEQLQELNASKDKFFSIIAHDLKSPFQSLLGYSEILSNDIEKLEKDDIKRFSHNLYVSSENLFKLLENLLEWSRLQRGVLDYRPDNYLLTDITLANIDLAKMKANEKEIELKHDVPHDIWIYSDYNMINTVLRNLISNSLKFTENNGTIEVGAHIDENVNLFVRDNGVGINLKAQEKIFRIDEHHSTLGTGNEQGTGLGLILCKELIEKNQGSIRVESEEGKGTTFFISIPKGNLPTFDDE